MEARKKKSVHLVKCSHALLWLLPRCRTMYSAASASDAASNTEHCVKLTDRFLLFSLTRSQQKQNSFGTALEQLYTEHSDHPCPPLNREGRTGIYAPADLEPQSDLKALV